MLFLIFPDQVWESTSHMGKVLAIKHPRSRSSSPSFSQDPQTTIAGPSDDAIAVSADKPNTSAASEEEDFPATTDGPEADIEYNISLSITGEEGYVSSERGYRNPPDIHFEKPSWWDTDRYYTPNWL